MDKNYKIDMVDMTCRVSKMDLMGLRYKRYFSYVFIGIILSCVMILVAGCGSGVKSEAQINRLIYDNKFDEARIEVNKLFASDPIRLKDVLSRIDTLEKSKKESKLTATSKKTINNNLIIQDGYTYKTKSDYIYINGSVKNTGTVDINYFEVKVDFIDDKGNILDSDYTNDGLTLKSGAMREFEIMHKYNEKYNDFRLLVGDVK